MKAQVRWLAVAVALWWAPVAMGAADYPAAVFDADNPTTKKDGTFTQSEQNQILDEIEATQNELERQWKKRGIVNLVANGSMEDWSGAVPDGWTLSGTGATASQQSDGQDGNFSAQITAGTAASKLSRTGLATISATANARFRGAPAAVIARVKTSVASACRVQLDDGVSTYQSSYHSGGGAWEILAVSTTLNASATKLAADLLNDKTDSTSTCRFDSVVLREGFFLGEAFHDAPGSGAGGTGDITAVGACPSGACFQSETQNKVLASPTSGTGSMAPRALVAGDIPAIPASKISDQHSGTNITADLEEETHAAEHSENAADEIFVEDLGTKCANGQVPVANATGGLDCGAGGVGGGSAVVLDLGDDAGNDSADLTEIATTGDTNGIFTEPLADKLLIDATKAWPTADALAANPTDCAAGALANAIDAAGNLTCTTQHAGTDITADLEEEAHAAEHEAAGADPIVVENMKTDAGSVCALEANGTGGVQCTTGTLTASSTATLTNKTLDAEATGNVVTIPAKLVILAASCSGTTAESALDLPSTGAATPACVEGTNTRKAYLDFTNSGTQDAYFHFPLPSDWVGSIDLEIKWLTSATSGDVNFAVRTACVADGETNDPAYNAIQDIVDAAKGTANQLNDASLSSLTTTGCAAGEIFHLKFFRRNSGGSDTLAATARLATMMLTVRRAM